MANVDVYVQSQSSEQALSLLMPTRRETYDLANELEILLMQRIDGFLFSGLPYRYGGFCLFPYSL
jgi:hypothetical protein